MGVSPMFNAVANQFFHPPFERRTLQQQAASARQAAQADVRAQARNLPLVAAAGMGLTQTHHVAQADFEDR